MYARRLYNNGLAGLGRVFGPTTAPAPRPVVNSMDPRAAGHQLAAQKQYDVEQLASVPWSKVFNPPPLENGKITRAGAEYALAAWKEGLAPVGFKTMERVGVVPLFRPGQQAYGTQGANYLRQHAPEIYQKILDEMRKRNKKEFTQSVLTIATIAIGGYFIGSAMAASAATAGTATTGAGTTAGTVGASSGGIGMTASAGQAAYAGQIAAAQTAATTGTVAAGPTGGVLSTAKTIGSAISTVGKVAGAGSKAVSTAAGVVGTAQQAKSLYDTYKAVKNAGDADPAFVQPGDGVTSWNAQPQGQSNGLQTFGIPALILGGLLLASFAIR
jgi:hypothetical protein